MKKFEYKEPEFKVVISAFEDVMTSSLNTVDEHWDTLSSPRGNHTNVGFTI